METYIDVFVNADGKKASEVFKKLKEMGLKSHIGDYDFIYDWEGIAESDQIEAFIDKIQSNLKGTGAILKFKTIR